MNTNSHVLKTSWLGLAAFLLSGGLFASDAGSLLLKLGTNQWGGRAFAKIDYSLTGVWKLNTNEKQWKGYVVLLTDAAEKVTPSSTVHIVDEAATDTRMARSKFPPGNSIFVTASNRVSRVYLINPRSPSTPRVLDSSFVHGRSVYIRSADELAKLKSEGKIP